MDTVLEREVGGNPSHAIPEHDYKNTQRVIEARKIEGIAEEYPESQEQELRRGAKTRSHALTELGKLLESSTPASIAKDVETYYSHDNVWAQQALLKLGLLATSADSLTAKMLDARGVGGEHLTRVPTKAFSLLFAFQLQAFFYERAYKKITANSQESAAQRWGINARDGILRTIGIKKREAVQTANLGEAWKGFVSLYPAEKYRYISDIPNNNADLHDIDQLSAVVYASARGFYELNDQIASVDHETNQPIGAVKYSRFERASVEPITEGEDIQVMIVRKGPNNKQQATFVSVNKEQPLEEIKAELELRFTDEKNWQDRAKKEQKAVIAINLDGETDRLYSKSSAANGFDFQTKLKPAVVIFNGTDTSGNKHLQYSFDHLPFDGNLSARYLRGDGNDAKGVAGFYTDATQTPLFQEVSPPVSSNEVRYENYGDVVIAEFAKDHSTGADMYIYAFLKSLQLYKEHKRQTQRGIFAESPPSTSGNVVISESNPFMPLAVGTDSLGDADSIPQESAFYDIRHAVMMVNCLVKFRNEKQTIQHYKQDGEMPATMKSMEIMNNTTYPDWIKKATLALNETDLFTLLREGIIFPSTVTWESKSIDHTTPAGRDWPNPCFNILEDRVRINFNVDNVSKFVPPENLQEFVEFIVPCIRDVMDIAEGWSEQKLSLQQLNDALENLDNKKLAELQNKENRNERHNRVELVRGKVRQFIKNKHA